jgi:C-terminal processing protease CtpA/Prc
VDVDELPGGGRHVVRVVTGPRSFLGVQLTDLSPELREHFGAPRDAGVLIASVNAESPASRAGLKVGDVVTKAGGKTVSSPADLSRAVRDTEAGGKLSLGIVRDKSAATLDVTVAERKHTSREIRVGDGGFPHAWNFRIPEFDEERFDRQMEKLKEKLAALEAKLKDLERRLSAK